MYNIKIEMGASYEGQADTYTVEPQNKTVTITHESRSIIDFDVKSETKTLSVSEFQPIEDAFDKLNFTKVFKESGDLAGYDGWTLKCTVGKIMSSISVLLWCPEEDSSKPETTKLLKACDKIIDLFPKEDK